MASLMDQAEEVAKKNTMTPVTQDFDESKGVEQRVARITATDSPLMTQAATTGAQSAAARGLTNSSLASQASQQAVIAAATPIATADASLSSSHALANQTARNAAGSQNAQTGATLGNTAMQAENSNQQQDKSLASEAALRAQQQSQFDASRTDNQANFGAELSQRQKQFDATQTQQLVLSKMDSDSRMALANLEAANRQAISSNDSVANAWGSMMQNISQVQNNPNLDAAAKQTLIANQVAAFQSYTNFWKKLTGGTIDVTDLLSFGSASGPNGTTTSEPPKKTIPVVPDDFGNPLGA